MYIYFIFLLLISLIAGPLTVPKQFFLFFCHGYPIFLLLGFLLLQ